ncbi:hypothetical protein DCE93_14200 [Agromyces badenianii]|uniref:Uncharacterized protein n=1 Tax=Agromyces badenianii TaxID=2080742 RepID=A0A2S0X092_9MICO|nr:DUF308 domain-containing protein [Agromyces badenianii]AWB97025.1 hypothetical protein DCE93_14200 [Agromyces badenianii]PWC05950.1 hypothetical protein DCE94_04735 [Agromyces badenianii]
MAIAAAPERARYWVVPVVRGILALVPAAVITFSQNHSPDFGLLVFGVWAIVSGLLTGALSLRFTEERGIRSLFVIAAVVTVAAGLLAVSVPGGLPFLLYLVSVWAAITGVVELFAGLRARGRTSAARDWVAAGAFTALLAIVFLVLPLDAVTAVGLLGGYLVILGVYLVIGGFSLKWATGPADAAPDAPGTEQLS